MRKIFLVLFFLFISIWWVFASNDIEIISREEWWADEDYRYLDSSQWISILDARAKQAEIDAKTQYTQAQIDAAKKAQEKNEWMNAIFNSDFKEKNEIVSKITTENWRELAWPITKTKTINSIVIHHTDANYSNSIEGIKSIYKYHAITKQRWDIWYNYLIWTDWKIYEWRAWWDWVVAAHDMWNNMWSVWIALVWNYSSESITDKQYTSLKKLITHLVEKYNIDLTKKTKYHKECIGKDCSIPLLTFENDPIIWHRDAGYTDCPWEALYKQIQTLKEDLSKVKFQYASTQTKTSTSTTSKTSTSTTSASKQKTFNSLSKISDDKLISILAKVESDLDTKVTTQKKKVKELLIEYFEYKKSLSNSSENNYSDKKIKIKLSYPDNDKITIKSGTVIFDVTRKDDWIYVKWKKYDLLTIPKKNQDDILEITSWSRIPAWDKTWKYNDNKFRWDLTLYVEDGQLVVVNELKIEDYLKWLWEVSNDENAEKIKTIIIAARTYATRYVTMDRKFPWKYYDWIDNPDVFQKYLWYSLESRSPNINKIVKETEWKIITYNWKIIKPWYFSNSDWKTLSYYDYCIIRSTENVCLQESAKYPFLQSVEDKWSEWKNISGHWVWISWAWVSYFAKKGWTYDIIIKYFLKWVEVL